MRTNGRWRGRPWKIMTPRGRIKRRAAYVCLIYCTHRAHTAMLMHRAKLSPLLARHSLLYYLQRRNAQQHRVETPAKLIVGMRELSLKFHTYAADASAHTKAALN